MTIALGMLATDGVVLAADTLVTYGFAGATPHSMVKIRRYLGDDREPVRRLTLITGAGEPAPLEALMERLGRASIRSPIVSLEQSYETALREYYEKSIIPLAADPNARPGAELIFSGLFGQGLYQTRDMTIRRMMPYAAVGVGASVALDLLARLWRSAPAQELQWLAAWIVYVVKRTVEGCGRETYVEAVYAPRSVEGASGARLVNPDPLFTALAWQDIEQFERTTWGTYQQTEIDFVWACVQSRAATAGQSDH